MNDLWQALQQCYSQNESLVHWLGSLSVLMFLGTLVVVPVVIVALPHDFLARREQAAGPVLLRVWYYPYLILKNVAGFAFILAGLLMLVLPGQGLLTMFLGLALINFPRKRALIRRLVGQRRIIRAINRLRRRFSKPSLELPDN